MAKKKVGSAGRFGARYGGPIKHKLSKIEAKQKKKYTCPKCLKDKIKRVSAGIWQCKNCNVKFAGKAYAFDE
ncbi:50S ribosomal protein L37ae [Candidatus Woesearchaeota archaeon]|jgi:large subunit ribosomal protein L37Ae|nr:50S ribosomal protein L37ae [Candidatus Woesearchaeota archaeon]MBT4322199.1 50S ribosomal protein L37ae [Candidatus Woesearchaeota archaeon]MBT4631219.1 50S ribosomal protein L37ae [Candidatus Woesearchaeota archaeon]